MKSEEQERLVAGLAAVRWLLLAALALSTLVAEVGGWLPSFNGRPLP